MMSPTHIGVGITLATVMFPIAPEFAVIAAIGGIAGGIFPDLDLFVGVHRKTLHFPVYYWIPTVLSIGAAIYSLSSLTVFLSFFFASAAIHSGMDLFGAGPEPRPWNKESQEAVYAHTHRRWLAPKYWIRYDGAPEDLFLSIVLIVPGIILFTEPIPVLATVALVVGILYVAIRKEIPDRFGDRI